LPQGCHRIVNVAVGEYLLVAGEGVAGAVDGAGADRGEDGDEDEIQTSMRMRMGDGDGE
jgi:hypothetical protein